jgi:hypothetical protein
VLFICDLIEIITVNIHQCELWIYVNKNTRWQFPDK